MVSKFEVLPYDDDAPNLKETAAFLKAFNQWRRSGEGEMPSPYAIGVHLDIAIGVLEIIEARRDAATISRAEYDRMVKFSKRKRRLL